MRREEVNFKKVPKVGGCHGSVYQVSLPSNLLSANLRKEEEVIEKSG